MAFPSVEILFGRMMPWPPPPASLPPEAVTGAPADGLRLSDEEAWSVGRRIWVNESGGTILGLTHWNSGEEFASLGIAHFIWYPTGVTGPFIESFKALLGYLEGRRVSLPDWLRGGPACPWPDGLSFYKEFQSPRMRELRGLLEGTVSLQARFAADRLERALPRILESLPEVERHAVRAQFYRVAGHPVGVYALVDYVNFKGEGVSLSERYNGQGWGLLQVLQEMTGGESGPAALDEFARAADVVLTRRVANSPRPRHDERWLAGWRKRLSTYRAPLSVASIP